MLIACAVWAGAGVLAWTETKEKIDEFFDTYQMALARQLSGADWSNVSSETQEKTDKLIKNIHNADDEDEAIGFAIFTPSGQKVFHDDENGKDFQYQDANGRFVEQKVDDESWRVVWLTSTDGNFRIAVGQELEYREDMAWDMLEEFMTPWAGGLLILLVAVIFIISRELKPLKRLTGEINARSGNDLSPLNDDDMPSEIKPLTSAMNQQLVKISDMLQRERRFISDAAHELRTPLTSMSYALTNMGRGLCGALPDKAKDYVGRLQVDVKRLLTTVNDILDLRQMENGTLTLRKSCVPLARLFGEVVDSLSIQAQTKRQTLTLAPAPKEIYAEADRHKIERVCFNILSNAIKYTPDGGAIAVSVTARDGLALLRVDDTGIGIPPEALPRVSQRYFRVGDQVAGTGLGLSIVREIVELHGGKLHIESPVPETDRGTRVTVTLPACPGPTLVIVSGDEAFIADVSREAEAVGLSVHVDREAIDLPKGCAGVTPARFLLDGSLPESYLGDLVCQIRGDARLSPTPILILSPGMEPSRRAEYARMRVEVSPWPQAPKALRAVLRA